MTVADDLCFLSAGEMVELVRRRAVSPIELADAALERIAELNPALTAFCTLQPDKVRAAARDVEARLLRGEMIGPLAGVPIGIKDLIFTRDLPTTGGSSLYREFVPEEDDIVVERVRRAGAIILGKTNVPEFGFGPGTQNPTFGATRNPWDPSRTSGGSSGGSAVAVATGMGPVALGSDGGGSIRTPASFCGVYGLKPSFGRVPLYPGCRDPRYPGFSAWESLEHIGPITRTVADAALLLDILAGPDPRDRHSLPRENQHFGDLGDPDLHGLRIAWSADLGGYARVAAEVRAAFDAGVQNLAAMGASVEEAHPGFDDPGTFFESIVALESDMALLRQVVAEHPEAVNPRIARLAARAWEFGEVSSAMTRRKETYNHLWRFFERYDLLVTPTAAVAAYDVEQGLPREIDGSPVMAGHYLSWFTSPFNLTGNPAASVPCGWTEQGLPVGLQIVGNHLADALVLRASRALEVAAPWTGRKPAILEPAS